MDSGVQEPRPERASSRAKSLSCLRLAATAFSRLRVPAAGSDLMSAATRLPVFLSAGVGAAFSFGL